MSIAGNMIGSYSQLGKTFIITDEDGIEYTGVVTDKEVIFTANAATDIREGTVAATDEGIVTGSAVVPNYETTTGVKIITSGSEFKITLTWHDMYDYTKLQCIICKYNSSINDSVAADRVFIGDDVYGANSVISMATVTKNRDEKSIDLNLTNTSDGIYVVRYFTYKELY